MTGDYTWIVCRGADGEVQGAVGVPVLTPEETAARAQRYREWRDQRYPGPAVGRDPEAVRLIAERKAARGGGVQTC
jgi:hypothetical protein